MKPEILKTLLTCFSSNLELMFNKKTSPLEEVNTAMRPELEDDYICAISLANQAFQGQIVAGFSDSMVNSMLEEIMGLVSTEEEAKELIQASLGELLNTVGGDFAQCETATAVYEWLDLSTPSVSSGSDRPFFCKSEGLAGQIQFNDSKANIYITISAYRILEPSDDKGVDISDFLDDDLDDLLSGL